MIQRPTTPIPSEIKTAVDALLRPYGYKLDALLSTAQESDKEVPTFLSISDLAKHLGCTKPCIRQLIRKGCFPAYKTSNSSTGGKILIPVKSVQAYLQSLSPWMPAPIKNPYAEG